MFLEKKTVEKCNGFFRKDQEIYLFSNGFCRTVDVFRHILMLHEDFVKPLLGLLKLSMFILNSIFKIRPVTLRKLELVHECCSGKKFNTFLKVSCGRGENEQN